MAISTGGLRISGTVSRSTTNGLGKFTISAHNVNLVTQSNSNREDVYLHARVLINGQQVSYQYTRVPARTHQPGGAPDGSLTVNKTTASQSITVALQVSVTRTTTPGAWKDLVTYTVTVPAFSTSHYDFYNDEAMTDLYKRIDVYETQYLTVPSAIPSVAMSEWVDSDGTVYQFDSQVQNTSMQELTYKFRPVFLPPDIKIKVKVNNKWIDGDIKCKINDEWLDADAIYVKINDIWIKI